MTWDIQYETPSMVRSTDPEESKLHDAAIPKGERSRLILERLKTTPEQTYTTLCDFGQFGGPAANRTLLTQLERQGFVRKQGRKGTAAAFVLTARGQQVVA